MVAEGIEDGGAVALLQSMGCDLGQGYHFARPVEMAELIELMRSCRLGVAVREAAVREPTG
jgi:EAL domain-containing protein (putative c-di-GMP-specific phosphodiesterase class I)